MGEKNSKELEEEMKYKIKIANEMSEFIKDATHDLYSDLMDTAMNSVGDECKGKTLSKSFPSYRHKYNRRKH